MGYWGQGRSKGPGYDQSPPICGQDRRQEAQGLTKAQNLSLLRFLHKQNGDGRGTYLTDLRKIELTCSKHSGQCLVVQ